MTKRTIAQKLIDYHSFRMTRQNPVAPFIYRRNVLPIGVPVMKEQPATSVSSSFYKYTHTFQ